MLWHLDQYRKAKQSVSISKAYIGNTDRAPILPTYRTFLSPWSSLTGKKYLRQKPLQKYTTNLYFFNTKSDVIDNTSMFLNKTLPAWTKGLPNTIKNLCTVTIPGFITADEFIKSHTPRKHIHNPRYLDYLGILELSPKDWQNKIKQNTGLSE